MADLNALEMFGKNAGLLRTRTHARRFHGVITILMLPLLLGARFPADHRDGPIFPAGLTSGIIMVRKGMTGRTWQFKPNAETMQGLMNSAGIEVDDGGQLPTVRIKGKSFGLQELDPSTTPAPSCRVNRILRLSPPNEIMAAGGQFAGDGIQVGGMVLRDTASGETYHVTVRNQTALSALKVGHDVSMVTSAGTGEWAGRRWAVVRVEIGGMREAYTFPVSLDASPDGPSSTVILTDTARRTVTIRDNKTGHTLQFDAGDTPLVDLHPYTGIEISGGATNRMGNVDSINKFYALNEPIPGNPCCAITGIQVAAAGTTLRFGPVDAISLPDGNPKNELHGIVLRDRVRFFHEVDGIVELRDSKSGATHQVGVNNRAVLTEMKVGQQVTMDPAGRWAFFRAESAAASPTYTFQIQGTDKKPGPAAETLWEIRTNAELKGALGRLLFGFTDSDAIGGATILPTGQADGGTLVFLGDATPLPPGKYDVIVNGVPVKNVPIETRMETVMKVGLLSVTAGIKAGIYDLTKKTEFKFVDGGKTILPAGSYYLKSTGGFTMVVIREKQVTEF